MLGAQEPSEKMTEHTPRTTGAGVTPGSGGAGTEGHVLLRWTCCTSSSGGTLMLLAV